MEDWDIQLRSNLFLFLLWETPSSKEDCVFCVCEHICIIDTLIPSESLECIDTVFGGNRSVFGVYFGEEDCLQGSDYGILFWLTAESFVKLTRAALEIAAARGGMAALQTWTNFCSLHFYWRYFLLKYIDYAAGAISGVLLSSRETIKREENTIGIIWIKVKFI